MKQRYPILDRRGEGPAGGRGPYSWGDYRFLTQIGDYDLLYRARSAYPYAVVCDPRHRKPGKWNVACVDVGPIGTVSFSDQDVELDPYHMCLLYQAIEDHRKGD
jgi:hypothetical protein